MAQTVKIKRSAVAGKVPTTSDLELGELAVNTYDGKLYTKKDDGTAAIVQLGPGPAVGGSNTQVLFNDSGAIGGDAGLTYDKTTDALTAAGSVTAASLIPTSSTAPTNGVFLPAANTVGIATDGTERLRISSSGRIFSGNTYQDAVFAAGGASNGASGVQKATGFAARQTMQDNTANYGFISWPFRTSGSTSGQVLSHFYALAITVGEPGVTDTQYGFHASNFLTGATNNFGFYGNIASATGRWNFYANGTAPNYFAGDVRSNTVVTQRTAPTNSNATATTTAASLLDGIRTGTPTADIDLQVPTGTNMDAAFQELQTNQSFEWSVINLATAASGFDITVTANTGHTVVGRMVVTGETSGRFLTRKTAANTFITYRIA